MYRACWATTHCAQRQSAQSANPDAVKGGDGPRDGPLRVEPRAQARHRLHADPAGRPGVHQVRLEVGRLRASVRVRVFAAWPTRRDFPCSARSSRCTCCWPRQCSTVIRTAETKPIFFGHGMPRANRMDLPRPFFSLSEYRKMQPGEIEETFFRPSKRLQPDIFGHALEGWRTRK